MPTGAGRRDDVRTMRGRRRRHALHARLPFISYATVDMLPSVHQSKQPRLAMCGHLDFGEHTQREERHLQPWMQTVDAIGCILFRFAL